jgi:ketol-acid reductoisomerase
MKIYYDKDANMKLLKGKKVAVIGYGSQGFAHSNNLKESGIEVMVGLRKGSKSWDKAAGAGLRVVEPAEAAKKADIIMVLVPDELQGAMYKKDIEGNIKKGAYLAFAHGFNIHFGQIVPREDVNVFMVAPKRPSGPLSVYQGRGCPWTHRSPSGPFEKYQRHCARIRFGDRLRQGGGNRDIVPRRDGDRPLWRAGSAVRRHHGAYSGRV